MITKREIRNCDTVKDWYWRKDCLISIRSNTANIRDLRYWAHHVLQLDFDDVLPEARNEDTIGYHYKLFTDFDAMRIAKFIKFYNQCCERVVFQCEAGISRSVWCCEAFLLHYYWEEVHKSFIKEHRFGNKFVRDKLKKAMEYLDKYDLQSKEKSL